MKKIKSLIAGAFIALAALAPVAIVAVPAVSIVACRTSPLIANFKTYGELKDSVAAARIEWADYVVATKIAAGNITNASARATEVQSILAKQAVVNAALQVWFDRNAAYRDAQKASAQTLPAPPDVLDAGNAYLAAVKANKI